MANSYSSSHNEQATFANVVGALVIFAILINTAVVSTYWFVWLTIHAWGSIF